MTSTASQTQIPAPNPNPATAAPSYASAAGASKKPASTPVIATGTNPPPVVVGSSAPSVQHGKSSSVSPVNGRPPITPAVPTVVHGSSNLNGGSADHTRKSSVTISATGPSNYSTNGGSKSGIQFGFSDSPAVAHSTPQSNASAPIPIPGSTHRIPSPAHSPSPIPQPSASGGKPPTVPADGSMKFGSFGGDGERHLKQHAMHQPGTPLGAKASPHMRTDSVHSVHSDMGNHVSGSNRGGYSHQGRGRGFNQPQYGQNMGFPPGAQYPRGPAPGRGGMPSYGQGRGGMPQYPNSPQPNRASPALPHSMPHHPGTPNMSSAMPMQGYPTQHNFPPPMGQIPPYAQQGYGYAPPYNPGAPMGYPNYPQMQYMNPPNHSPSPSFQQPYTGAQFVPPAGPGAQAMSRNSSQVSERPSSSTGQGQPPVIASGTPQPHNTQPKAPSVPSNAFVIPNNRKSAAIKIMNPQGEALDLSNIKTPASPASSIQQSKTPPIIASTPTPPPKPSTPGHGRSESSTTKSAEQLKKEFQEQVRKTAESLANAKSKVEEAVKAPEEPAKQEPVKVETNPAEEKPTVEELKEKPENEAAQKEEPTKDADIPVAKQSEPAVEDSAAAEAPSKDPADMTEEELDAMFAEMEAQDKKREQEQAELTAKKKAEQEEAKKRAEAERLAHAAENDRKLREQEREMERIEEEREKKRKEGETKTTKAVSATEALASKIEDLKLSDKKDSAPASPSTVADKLANLSINKDETSTDSASSAAKPGSTEKRAKPTALNLSLNTKSVEPPQPSAALQSLKSARFLTVRDLDQGLYPSGILSPNPALNAAVAKKGKTFRYDSNFLLQFQKVFTEQPSVEFNHQVKSLIGDNDGSRSASTRTPAGSVSGRQNSNRQGSSAFNGMGHFNAPAKPGPVAGSTSAERFAWSQTARPAMNPMSSFGRPGGAFPGGSQMTRTPSSSAMGGLPNSPRQGSRSTRNDSRRNPHNAKAEAQAAKTMPLTAGMEIKPISISSTGWKPNSLAAKTSQAPPVGQMDPATVQRKVKAALNKMTPEKFDKIADQILEIAAQSKDESDGRTLRQVIQLTFEKATDEAHWASMYAKFCRRMLDTMSPEIRDTTILDKNGNVVSGGALFRKYLLNRCQEEFERGWKMDLPEKEGEEGKSLEAVMLSDEYYIAAAAKRRGLGLVQFIGELYKLGMLTERIMHECVRKLVDYQGIPDDAEIESLSKLLRTIGGNLDATEKGKLMMDAYFSRIQAVVEMPDLPSRLKFMLMDIVDLRRMHWVSKESNKGPKTLEEIRAEAEAQAAQKAAENARSNQRGGPGRPQMGRGDARGFPQYNQPAPNQVGMDDLRRLKGSASRSASGNVTLGPTSMFSSRSNSGRRLGPGGSLGRTGEDSGASSRTGTPPTREGTSHSNAFGVLANMESENPASPPSTAASPALSKAAPDASGAGDEKKRGD